MTPSEHSKRILGNTMNLYFRMFLTMVVSLFTVRIILQKLGVIDYGIYHAISSLVLMASFTTDTVSAACQRFFAFELGQNNAPRLKKIFSITISICAIIALVFFLLAETIGVWFLNTRMLIPEPRLNAATWVYQFSILSFIVTIMTVPYNCAIIARENMRVFAYTSILEAVFRLFLVYTLTIGHLDKLKLYACLMFAVTCIMTLIYREICRKNYQECRFTFHWDSKLVSALLNYSGWSLFGTLANTLSTYGVNILLNIFFGPAVNAARGIAFRINSVINQFVMNFLTAVKSPITKLYASGNTKQMLRLVFQSSKLSFFVLFVLSMPVLLETDFILTLWLKKVPDYVIIFSKLVIINALINSFSYPLTTAAAATGKIKYYQMTVGGVLLLNLPVSYYFLKSGSPPQIIMYVAIILSCISLFFRLGMLRKMIGLSIIDYIKKVISVVFSVTITAYIIPALIASKMTAGPVRFLIVAFTGLITSLSAVFILGLSREEKGFFCDLIRNKLKNDNTAKRK